MKRLHVHVGVEQLDASIGFYSNLFGQQPCVVKPDYAKWMLDDPRVNFAISHKSGARRGVEHLGIQVEDAAELADVYGRLRAAGGPILEEAAATCCYAKSEKSWIADPDGVVWETFRTHGDATVYGDGPDLEKLASDAAASDTCCAPTVDARPVACCG